MCHTIGIAVPNKRRHSKFTVTVTIGYEHHYALFADNHECTYMYMYDPSYQSQDLFCLMTTTTFITKY